MDQKLYAPNLSMGEHKKHIEIESLQAISTFLRKDFEGKTTKQRLDFLLHRYSI